MVDVLKIILNQNNNEWTSQLSLESVGIIRNKLSEIPKEFFEPRISLDDNGENKLSLIQFAAQTVNMSKEKRSWLMEKYHINPYDMNKLQGIIDSIRVAKEFGVEKRNEENKTSDRPYGIALSSAENLDKAYPLWLAYLYADSKNPIEEIGIRLKEDKMDGKYKPEYIVSLMEHTDSLLNGKSVNEKKDFYMQTINGVLSGRNENLHKKEEIEI